MITGIAHGLAGHTERMEMKERQLSTCATLISREVTNIMKDASPFRGHNGLVRAMVMAIALALSSPQASGQTGSPTWTALGPYGGFIDAMAIDPSDASTVYVGARGVAIFKSTNGGASWNKTGLAKPTIYSEIIIDPQTTDHIYATTAQGFYLSTDGGATWTLSNEGLTRTYLTALAIDSANPSTLYAGAWGGVFKSTDGGATWADASSGLGTKFVSALVLNPVSPNIIYAATTEGGVYKSTDSGANWTPVLTGLGDPFVWDLVLDPTRPNTLYAATNSQGVFKTTDGGASWTLAGDGGSTQAFRLAIDPRHPDIVYLGAQGNGVFKTTDGGQTWIRQSQGLPPSSTAYALAVDSTGNTVYAGLFQYGLYTSTDGAASWVASNAGLTGHEVSSLILDPDISAIYAGIRTYGPSIFRSTDGGTTWTMTNRGIFYPPVHVLVRHPTDAHAHYCGNSGSIFKTADRGNGWFPADQGLPRGSVIIYSLAIDPSHPDTLRAAIVAYGKPPMERPPGRYRV